LEVDRDKDRVVVEGINMISKHTKPNAKNPNGGIIKKEAPVHISNVMLLDPTSVYLHELEEGVMRKVN
jgi:large subunit ribosomal protein L24